MIINKILETLIIVVLMALVMVGIVHVLNVVLSPPIFSTPHAPLHIQSSGQMGIGGTIIPRYIDLLIDFRDFRPSSVAVGDSAAARMARTDHWRTQVTPLNHRMWTAYVDSGDIVLEQWAMRSYDKEHELFEQVQADTLLRTVLLKGGL